MPVWINLSGSSLIFDDVSSAMRWLALSLLSQAPPGNWKFGFDPTTVPYQSIISFRRVVLRLTWCSVGWLILVVIHEAPLGLDRFRFGPAHSRAWSSDGGR